MNTILLLVAVMIVLELLEAWWQKADTLMGVLANSYHYYQKSVFLFFLMHPTFYYTLFVILLAQVFNGWMVTILLLKSVDIFFKLAMIKSIFVQNRVDDTLGRILYEPLSPWIFLTGASLYPFLLFYALT